MATLRQQEQNSVQEFAPADSLGSNSIWFVEFDNGSTLPAWGLHNRDRVLRNLYRNPYNWIGQSAVAALVRKVKSTPWQIKAGRNNVAYFQTVLQQAQFTKGWDNFISRLLLDFLTCDYGAYIEVIGRGNPNTAIKGRVVGIAALDSLRCIPTGNNEYPVVYYDKYGKLHRMHHTRVVRMVDMPDGDESRHLAGLSSMSRAAAMIEQQIPMNEYISSTFDTLPPIGIFYNNANLTESQWKDAWTSYKSKLKKGKAGMLTLNNGDNGGELKGEFLRFATTPDGFDYDKYTEIAVNAYAAAFGIDRQDIWPLTGKMAGTGTQSEILHEKAKGMAFGDLLRMLERAINNFILPPNAEFSFEYQDEEKDIQITHRDNALMDISAKMFAQGFPESVVMRYLANNSETFRDVMTDEDGEIIELPDDDVKPASGNDDLISTDNTGETAADAPVMDERAKASKEQSEAFAYIPLPNNPDILRVQRELKKIFVDDRIEWQSAPTLHITLCYAKLVSDEAIEKMVSLIDLERVEIQPVQGNGLEYFETPDGKALHIPILNTSVLDAIQYDIYSAFLSEAYDLSDFSKPELWKPHVTLAYIPDDIEINTLELNDQFDWLDAVFIQSNEVIIGRDDYDPVVILQAPEYVKALRREKAIQATRLDFENRYDDFLADIRAGNLNRRRAGIILRGMLRTFGFRALRDGLEDGGVDPTELDASDEATGNRILSEQSQYVSNFTDTLINGNGISDAVAKQKAAMWFNKSIMPFYDAGLMSADRNGMYEWVLGEAEHCDDCLRLNGQRHRLKSYLEKNLYPKSSKLACGGFNCACNFAKTTERARGRF